MAGPDLRLGAAIGLGKLVGSASRRLGLGGGTTLPGDVARAIDPHVLAKLASTVTRGTVLVTGTNGKTSTAAMLRTIAAAAGWRVGGNPSGSNLVFGLTAATLDRADRHGRVPLDWMILEVDELSAPQAVAEIQPRGLVVLNAFRDQLDRSFEVEQIAGRLEAAVNRLPASSFWVGNADDPRVALIGAEPGSRSHRSRILFGLDDPSAARAALPVVADARVCPRCRGELEFSAVYYAHCGAYACPNCGFTRPDPDVRATNIQLFGLDSLKLRMVDPSGLGTSVSVPLGGVFNAANVAAAFATATAMGATPAQVSSALATFQPAFGRSQLAAWKGTSVRLMLAKNPAGMGENLASLAALDASPVVAIALNDGIADGRDISWIWDVDLEGLARGRRLTVVASGTRCGDLVLRLAYAGFERDQILVCPEPQAALDALAEMATKGVAAPALLTYTAMLNWQRLLVRSGASQPFRGAS
ncbi:MAG TPA: MurT ligase domain-containing protein [Candidatus Nanopelagicaceae bacterium]|nr:MurT ligase domain-containing protein [Candidatus Nanopelagicaceae bacterium]